MNIYNGGCHCKNVSVIIKTAKSLNEYEPRACDCDFCTKHGAAFISDNKGELTFKIQDYDYISHYNQGDRIINLIVCKKCGVFTGGFYKQKDKILATLNSIILDGRASLKPAVPASPKQ